MQRVLLGLAVGIALCGVALVVTRALASRGESPAPVDSPWPAGHERLARTNQTNVAGRDHQLGRLDDTAAAQAVEDLREWPGQRFGHQPLLDRVWSLRA
ncbi:MAG: hypothetical protein ACRD12_15565, partial [Acidimicrobiales bacterium]